MRTLLLAALLLTSIAQAQTYVWIDENGQKHYSDQPPPPSVQHQQRRFGPNGAARTQPYRVREAARSHPVTLYTGDSCPLCDDARKLLKARGVPFTEKKVGSQEELDALTERFDGNGLVPSIEVGSAKFAGYIDERWHALLDDAGYPKELKGLQ
ncbi:MAG: glutaredoxin family protein [Rhodocyclaceae bacterium]|nr:glutaredoxin family protein [Rhodocyclaceae bacterium]